MNAVTVKNLSKVFRQGDESIRAVDNISFTVAPGELVAIVGQSGSGKTTLLNLIGGIEHPSSGSVEVGGMNVCTADDETLSKIRRKKIGYIFQDFNLIPILTAEENIIMPLLLDGKRPDKARLRELASFLGIERRLKHLPGELSGGQRQRVGIARALIMNPKLIIADECISALDVSIQAQVVNLMKDIQQETGTAYLFIAHDLSVVKHISNRIGVMFWASWWSWPTALS